MNEETKARLRAAQDAYRDGQDSLAVDRKNAVIGAVRDGGSEEAIAREMGLRPHQVQAILASIARDLIRGDRAGVQP